MKVIVTGGSGFVGTHTIKELQKKYEVFNFDIIEGYDICNYGQISSAVNKGDKILHLAAVSRFGDAEDDPVEAFKTNIGGTMTVLKAAREKGAERVVYSSTGSVFMPVWNVPIGEDHPISGNSVYGYSKAWSEKLFDYVKGVPFVILRYAHLYGKGKEWGAIGSFVNRIERGMKPIMFGGGQSNDFCYIKDVVQANILALGTENTNLAYNIGTGEELTIEQVYKTVQKVLKTDLEMEVKPLRGVDSSRFVYDISRAKKLLGYKPKYSLEEGLKDLYGDRK